MYTNNREAYRQAFYDAWQKYQKQIPLQPIELQIVDVILLHPEYHALLNNAAHQQEFILEENPFLHMSLHMTVREQIKLDRPAGVRDIYQRLLLAHEDPHVVEHLMVDCLGKVLWEAQESGVAPSEEGYLVKLQGLCLRTR